MPRGASAKREREYNELKDQFTREHRYPGREEEVAARIVNKQRKQFGETAGEKQKDKEGKSPDRNLPIENYQHLTIPRIAAGVAELAPGQKRQILEYERKHKNRKGVIELLQK